MSQLRLDVPVEWLTNEFKQATEFDAGGILRELIQVVGDFTMPNPKFNKDEDNGQLETTLFGNVDKLKPGITAVYFSSVGYDSTKNFLHVQLDAGEDKDGRTDKVRSSMAHALGNKIEEIIENGRHGLTKDFVKEFNLTSITSGVGFLATATDCYTTNKKRQDRIEAVVPEVKI